MQILKRKRDDGGLDRDDVFPAAESSRPPPRPDRRLQVLGRHQPGGGRGGVRGRRDGAGRAGGVAGAAQAAGMWDSIVTK